MNDQISIIFILMGTQLGLYAVAWWVYAALSEEDRDATLHWGAFNALIAVGMLLAWTRDETRGWAAYVGSSLCFITAFMVGWRGITAFTRGAQKTSWQLVLFVSTSTMLLYAGPGLEHAPLRVFATYICIALTVALGIYQIGPLLNNEFHWKRRWLIRVSSVTAVVLLGGRGLQQLLYPDARLELQSSDGGLNVRLLLMLLIATAVYNFTCLGLQLLRYFRRLSDLTNHDPLTGLLNRRAFEIASRREWQHMKRQSAPLAVAALDLDHFKSVNDEYGHAIGDLVLVHTAKLLRSLTREIDLVARFGGEEFVVVMPGASAQAAGAATERLCQALANAPVARPDGPPLRITTSIGLAMAAPGDTDVHDTLRRADEALYEAKNSGRNRVCLSPIPTIESALST